MSAPPLIALRAPRLNIFEQPRGLNSASELETKDWRLRRVNQVLTKEENELMTRVGPGTPAGEMLRRYWWPVAFTEVVRPEARPIKVKLLGEEFVLFRDGSGKLGLLELHCSHRGTSLEFGRV